MKKEQSGVSPVSQSGKLKSSRKTKLLGGLLLLGVSTTTVFANIPVFDGANLQAQVQIANFQETNRYTEFFETMNRWREQYEHYREQFGHAKAVWKEVNDMRGNWRGALERLADREFVKAVMNEDARDLARLGWDLRNPDREIITDQAMSALERIEKVMTARGRATGNNGFLNEDAEKLREDLEEVYGTVPGTRPDIENAHRTIARVTSSIGDINKAIAERRANIERWKTQISRGGLVPGDLERLQLMINAEQQDIALLNSRLTALNIEVNVANIGLQAAEGSDREIARQKAEAIAADFATGAGRMSNPTGDDESSPRQSSRFAAQRPAHR